MPSNADQPLDLGLADNGVEDLYLLFLLGTDVYGTKLLKISELLEPGVVRPVPDTVECFEGLLNVRGEIIAVIDLRRRFGIAPSNDRDSILVVFDTPHGGIAARVDKALKVAHIPDNLITKQPNMATPIPREYLLGAADFDGQIVAFIDLEKILSRSELAAIQSTVKVA